MYQEKAVNSPQFSSNNLNSFPSNFSLIYGNDRQAINIPEGIDKSKNLQHSSMPSSELLSDIFEVSINSKKLLTILSKFEQNFHHVNTLIEKLSSKVELSKEQSENKFEGAIKKLKAEQQDKGEELRLWIENYFRKEEEKRICQLQEKANRIKQLGYSIQTLNEKINKSGQTITTEFEEKHKGLSAEVDSLRVNLSKSERLFEEIFEEQEEKLQSQRSDIDNNAQNIFELETRIKRNQENIIRYQISKVPPCPDKPFEESVDLEKYPQLKTIKESTSSPKKDNCPKEKAKKSKRMVNASFFNIKKNKSSDEAMETCKSNQNYMSTLQYASISAKVQDLEKKIQNHSPEKERSIKENEKSQNIFQRMSLNKGTSNIDTCGATVKKCPKRMISCPASNDDDLLQSISNKIETIQKSMTLQEKATKKSLEESKQKELTVTEKLQFLKQKQNKIFTEVGELKIRILGLEKKSTREYENSKIHVLETELGKIIQKLEQEEGQKFTHQFFEKQKSEIYELIQLNQDNILAKSNKEDVKKALGFLESKIKEIILVIADEFNQDLKEGTAITKIQSKCLTCDKQIAQTNRSARNFPSHSVDRNQLQIGETLASNSHSNGNCQIKSLGLGASRLEKNNSSNNIGSSRYFSRKLQSKKENRKQRNLYNNYTCITENIDRSS